MTNNKYEIAIEALVERRDELMKEIEILNSSIDSLRQKSEKSVLKEVSENRQIEHSYKSTNLRGYDKGAPLAQKLAFFLNREKRFLHFREVAEMVVFSENSKEDPSILARKMSSATQSLKKNGTIVKYQHGSQNRNSFWGIPKWLDDNGNIKEEYSFNEEYLSSTGSKTESADLFNIQ